LVQAFQPNEAIKPGDMLTKRETKEFSTKELPIEIPITVRQMLQQYQVTIVLCYSLPFSAYCNGFSKAGIQGIDCQLR
jgi:hypothetical protein